jgi:hypothetical protein
MYKAIIYSGKDGQRKVDFTGDLQKENAIAFAKESFTDAAVVSVTVAHDTGKVEFYQNKRRPVENWVMGD